MNPPTGPSAKDAGGGPSPSFPFEVRAASLVFISDLHLSPSSPSRMEAFGGFLRFLREGPRPGGLFILGDLFDAWLGRWSLADGRYGPVLESLRILVRSGVPVTVLKGNRDFLLDGAFAASTGVNLVDEGLRLLLGGRTAFLCHGDDLFPEDRPHRRMRFLLRSEVVGALAAVVPAPVVIGIARWLRKQSLATKRPRGLSLPDAAPGRGDPWPPEIPPGAAARIFRGGCDLLIAGHVHEERRRSMEVDGRTCELFSLGDWGERGSVLTWDGEALGFHGFPIPSGEPPEERCSRGSS